MTEVHLLGRRGPVQAAFTPKELRELLALEGVQVRQPGGRGGEPPWVLAPGSQPGAAATQHVPHCCDMGYAILFA